MGFHMHHLLWGGRVQNRQKRTWKTTRLAREGERRGERGVVMRGGRCEVNRPKKGRGSLEKTVLLGILGTRNVNKLPQITHMSDESLDCLLIAQIYVFVVYFGCNEVGSRSPKEDRSGRWLPNMYVSNPQTSLSLLAYSLPQYIAIPRFQTQVNISDEVDAPSRVR